MNEKKWIDILAENSEEMTKLIQEDHEFLEKKTALDPITKHLFSMALDAVYNKPNGVKGYAKKAYELGATKEQIIEVIKILRIFAGRPVMITAIEGLREI